MYTQTRTKPVLLVAALLCVTAMFTSACWFIPRLGVRSTQSITVTITQDMLDNASPQNNTFSMGPYDNLLDTTTRVEFHDGFIRYVGTVDLPNGSKAPGTFDLSLEAKDDRLQSSIIAVNIPDVGLDDPRIVDANEELEYEMNLQVSGPNEEVQFKEVVLEEGLMKIKMVVTVNV